MDYSPEFRAKFHPEHLEDLAKSGLTDATITAAELYSARPEDIPKLVGWNPQGVGSALVFPYPGGEGFCRVKPFPPWRDKDGKEHKYLQRPGSGVHLYVTPSARAILKDPTAPLEFTEGEKKGLALHQAGIPAIALGGLDNWMQGGEPIHDLDGIAWGARPVTIADDSDIWSRPDLLRRVYAFAWHLHELGADISIRQIPPVNGARAGADDFLVAHGVEAYRALPRLALTHKAFTQAKAWHKAWLARRPAPPPDAAALRAQLVGRPRLRFAQDVWEDRLFYGIGSGDPASILTSGRVLIPVAQVAAQADIKAPRRAHNPLTPEAIQGFLAGANEPTAPLLYDLAALFDSYVVWSTPHASYVLACWALGTYVYQLFQRYPYLLITSAGKRSGKTRLLELVGAVSFLCRGLSTSPTEATIFRGAERHGGTETLDEVEPLMSGRGDRERACQAVLNAGYQKGATVPRVRKEPDGTQDLEEFDVYRPRALAGIGAFAETLEDRGITITLPRKASSQLTTKLLRRRLDTAAAALRDRAALWALSHADHLAATLQSLEDPDDLAPLDDRARDLWESLWLIAHLARQEGDPTAADALRAAVTEVARERQRAEQDTSLAALIEALLGACEGDETILRPTELLEKLKAELGDDAPRSPKGLTNRLKRLPIPRKRQRIDGKPSNAVILRRETLEALLEQYAPEATQEAPTPASLA